MIYFTYLISYSIIIEPSSKWIEPHSYYDNGNSIWGPHSYCSSGHYATGMQLKIESQQGTFGDDSALNAVRLRCSNDQTLISAEGNEGSWRSRVDSANAIEGVRLRSRSASASDDTAGNGVRFRDLNGREYRPGDGYWGDWSSTVYCPAGTVVTGLQTKARSKSTGIHRVKFYCSSP